MKKKKRVLSILFGIISLCISSGIFAYNTINNRLEKLTDQIINTPNLNEIADGKYTGEASVFPVFVKVEVEVKKHRIVTIDVLKHTNG